MLYVNKVIVSSILIALGSCIIFAQEKFYIKVQNGFINLMKKNKKSYLIVDSNLDVNHNKYFIIKKIKELIK